jgi:uncharacterized protein YbjT (DUF2867 family)
MPHRADGLVVVTGGTGRQGGSVARHLLADGWNVAALVRNPDSPAAQMLVDQGVELRQGDLEDRASIDAALKGANGVYSVQSWKDGIDAEVRQGFNLAEAAAAAGVEHFVYSSVGGVERDSGVPHFESKWRIEERIRELDLPYTIWRPVYFMENLLWQKDAIQGGHLVSMMDPEVPLQFIAVEDIGAFVAMSFRTPGTWLGKCTEIASDELTFNRVAELLSCVVQREVLVDRVMPPAEPERQIMARWFETAGYHADLDRLRVLIPELTDFGTWASIMMGCLSC